MTALAFVVLWASPAKAEWNGTVGEAGIETGVTSVVLERADKGLDLQTGKPDSRVFEYTSATACSLSRPGGANSDSPCQGAILACAGNTPGQGQGPQVRLYRRELDPSGKPLNPQWELVGTTCYPELVPGKKVLGMAKILEAFHNTNWARPVAHTQPEGNITLVTLPTYFQVTWPAAGFQPGEIDTTTLLGNQIQIRPTLVGYTYHFGDGTRFGPTRSPGGTYPDGDITHAYPKAGTYPSHIDITYGGEFSISGRDWIQIPDTITVPGQPHPLTVKTAHARLINR